MSPRINEYFRRGGKPENQEEAEAYEEWLKTQQEPSTAAVSLLAAFAGHALQGILSNPNKSSTPRMAARDAIEYARALIKELQVPEPPPEIPATPALRWLDQNGRRPRITYTWEQKRDSRHPQRFDKENECCELPPKFFTNIRRAESNTHQEAIAQFEIAWADAQLEGN